MTDDELIDAAMAIVGERPLADDAQSRLSALSAQIKSEEGKRQMGDLWEGFMAAGGILKFKD